MLVRGGLLMWLRGLLCLTFIAFAGTGVNLSHKEEYLDYALAMKVWLISLSLPPPFKEGSQHDVCEREIKKIQFILGRKNPFLLLVLQRCKQMSLAYAGIHFVPCCGTNALNSLSNIYLVAF